MIKTLPPLFAVLLLLPACVYSQGSRHQLEKIVGGRIAGQHFTGTGTNNWCNVVTHLVGQVHPAVDVPGFDQVLPPLLVDYLVQPFRNGTWQRAQRIAIQIDDAFR